MATKAKYRKIRLDNDTVKLDNEIRVSKKGTPS